MNNIFNGLKPIIGMQFIQSVNQKSKTRTMQAKNQLAGIIAAALILTFSACKKEDSLTNPGTGGSATTNDLISEKGTNPDEAVFTEEAIARHGQRRGYVYTESNDASQNVIHVYARNANGTLSPDGTTASGGIGTSSGLGSQGAVVLSVNNRWLFAVNAGSNSISSFQVHNDGSLTLAHTAGTSGIRPVSISVHGHLVYVVNAGSDNIAGFTLGAGGSLTPINGSVQSLSTTGAGAAQISFSPNGNYLFVTEKATNMITTFHVNGNGVTGTGTSTASVGQTPFGFEFARNNYMVVSNAAGGAAGLSSVTSYSGINSGNLNAVNGAVANNQAAACWIAVTKHGRFAFATNTASNNISSYYVAHNGALYLIHAAIPSDDGPLDMVIASNNFNAYTLNGAANTIGEYNRTLLGGLNAIGSLSNIPDHAAGLATF
ncbi:MAG: beta-propeller fold lactonase family protein [Nitrosopumilus sp.]|nr:beta-propeller fold lactonase family protein [Nitrosopumilus sp.]